MIIGSRREGNCLYLGKKIVSMLKNMRVPVSYIVPGNQKIYLCTGCMDCDQKGFCDFKDDMIGNIKRVREASLLIFITPVRWNLLSSDIKVFMDRLNPLYAGHELEGKKTIHIAIGAEGKENYSSEGAITSLGLFQESANMICLGHYTLNHCLQVQDQKKQEENVNYILRQVKKNIENL